MDVDFLMHGSELAYMYIGSWHNITAFEGIRLVVHTIQACIRTAIVDKKKIKKNQPKNVKNVKS